MAKTAAQLDREIAEFLAKPKLGDPEWERAWADLLTEKHSKVRMPTIDELARAFSYIEREFVIRGGGIDMEQWAEGLAFGQRYAADAEDKVQAKEALKQLPHAAWLRAAERANYLSREQGETPRYLRSHTAHSTIKTEGETAVPIAATPASKKIAKDIEAAVRAAQLYIGKGLRMRFADEQKLYRSMLSKIAAVAKRRKMDENEAYRQIMDEAKRRGGISPLPGMHI